MKENPDMLGQPVFVSQDGLILDGHHRWIAKYELDPEGTIPAIVAGCDMKELISLGHQFDGSFTKSISEMTIYGRQVFEDCEEEAEHPTELMVRKTLRPY